jgi:hypothetical protein
MHLHCPAWLGRAIFAVWVLLAPSLAPAAHAQNVWNLDAVGHALQTGSDGRQVPATVHSYSPRQLDRLLRTAPRADIGFDGAIRFPIPTPEGELVTFFLIERPTLSPKLQASHPGLRTYAGIREGDPTVELRLTRSSGVVIATVLGPVGWSLDSTPAELQNTFHMWKNSDDPSSGPSQCLTEAGPPVGVDQTRRAVFGSHGSELRVYEFAMTGTGEFAVFHGSVANAEAQIASLVNLANAILERELAVRFQLVDINVYPDPASDPFTDGLTPNGLSLDENQDALDRKLGPNNYELGHVVSRYGSQGWRGLAQPAAQCDRFGKARGATYAGAPTAGALLEGILHECGHQLGALHSFNGTSGSCAGNRNGAWAYEIASGVTLMSYAGICGSENVINTQRILMYNGGSLESIVTQMSNTSDCGSLISTENNPPIADAGPDYTIPRETAFELDGSGSSDLDPDALSWSWEQYDLGPASPPYGPEEGPLFRNFAPASTGFRSVPDFAFYRNSVPSPYEFLPSVDRLLTFRLIVRDNRSGGGGIAWDTATLSVAGSPFRVLAPNGGESFESGSEVSISWQVGGGSVAESVRILFSPDRGTTWSVLEAVTPNDGEHTVTIPCVLTSEGRVRIEPTDNIFFDITDADFAVTPDMTAPAIVCPAPFSVQATSMEGIDKDDPALADWIASAQAFDACDPDPTVTLASAQMIPIGTTTVAFLATDNAGNLDLCTTELTVTSPTASPSPPLRTALLGIYPNQMNPSAVISFYLRAPQDIRLAIYDTRGRLVGIAFHGRLPAGFQDVRWDGSHVPSGIYVARLETIDGVFTRRLALVK